MSRLLRRPTRQTCFYCQSEVLPRDPRSFKCSDCGCWNRYDANGEIMSDDPAMHDETLNARSFAKRASPRKDRFPATYGPSVFCHTCQTNQMLISNLLSNYLPSPDDPEYSRLYAQLPAYRASLETRYPPICASCLPAVEEEIKRRDRMAKTSALGTLLKQSKGKGKERQRQASGSISQPQRASLERELLVWRIRGMLWAVTLLCAVSCYGSVVVDFTMLRIPPLLYSVFPLFALVSILWTAWDPRYATFKRSQLQGREVRLRGKKEYNALQTLMWMSRLSTALLFCIPRYKPSWDVLHTSVSSHTAPSHSYRVQWYCRISLALELLVLLRSLAILRIDRPPPVRLMEQFSHRPSLPPSDSRYPSRHGTPVADAAPDLLSTLTLSNNPVLAMPGHGRAGATSPVFGMPSFAQLNGAANGHVPVPDAMDEDAGAAETDDPMEDDDDGERDPDAMDWSPLHPAHRAARNARRANGHRPNGARGGDLALRPQRFFAPEEPTGLEGLFEKTIKLADDDLSRREAERNRGWMGWVKGRWKS